MENPRPPEDQTENLPPVSEQPPKQEPSSQEQEQQPEKYPLTAAFITEKRQKVIDELKEMRVKKERLDGLVKKSGQEKKDLNSVSDKIKTAETKVGDYSAALDNLHRDDFFRIKEIIIRDKVRREKKDKKDWSTDDKEAHDNILKMLDELNSSYEASKSEEAPRGEPVVAGPEVGANQPDKVVKRIGPELKDRQEPPQGPVSEPAHEPAAPETEKNQFPKAIEYFTGRIEKANEKMRQINAEIAKEEAKPDKDKARIQALYDEMNGVGEYKGMGRAAIKDYQEILASLERGDVDSADKEIGQRLVKTEKDMKSLRAERTEKELEGDSEYNGILSERRRLLEVLGEFNSSEQEPQEQNPKPVTEASPEQAVPRKINIKEPVPAEADEEIMNARREKFGDVGFDDEPVKPEQPAEVKPVVEAKKEKPKRAERKGLPESEQYPQQEKLLKSFSKFTGFVKYRLGNPEMADENRDDAKLEYEHSCAAYQELTGKKFNEELRRRATESLAPGHELKTEKQFFEENSEEKIRKREQADMWSAGIKAAWDKLSQDEKNHWDTIAATNEKVKDKANRGARQFGLQLENERKKLPEVAKVEFTRDVYFKLFEQGLDPRTCRVAGWFGGKIKIRTLDGRWETHKKSEFDNKERQIQQDFDAKLAEETTKKMAEVKQEYIEGKNRWRKMKIKAAGDLVLGATKEYQAEVLKSDDTTANIIEQGVRPEEITPEREAEEEEVKAEEEYNARSAKLEKAMIDVAKLLKLKEDVQKQLRAYVNEGKGKPADIPVEKDILGALRGARISIETTRERKTKGAMQKRVGAAALYLAKFLDTFIQNG